MTMTITNVSSNYLTSSLLPSIQQTEATLASDGVELSTGQYADIGTQLGDQSGYELSLRNDNELLQSLTASNSIVTENLTTAQDALDSIRTAGASAQSDLTAWTSESTSSNATLESIGSTGLQSLVASANTMSNGSYVFGGENNSVAPMADSTTVTAAVTAAFQAQFGFAPTDPAASSLTVTQIQGFLGSSGFTSLFSSAGWTSSFSSASSTNTTAQIAPGETGAASTNINQAGFQQLTEGYAMLAVFGNAGLSSAAQQTVATSGMSLVTEGLSSITTQEATVGSSLATVSDASSSMASQMTILQNQIGNLDNVNTTAVATEITQLSTQLQTAYNLTAQIQKLSLAQYLPVS
jgi:flagellar hook-associated protein 3 FlgL